MKIPQIGLLICNSESSNSGTLIGIAGMEVVQDSAAIGWEFVPYYQDFQKKRESYRADLQKWTH